MTTMFSQANVPRHDDPLRVSVVPGAHLTPELCLAWSTLQRANPVLSSPYFTAEFTQTVAQVRRDVEVAVIEENGKVVAFLPFQRDGLRSAKPVAGNLSDFQAVIAAPGFRCDPQLLIRSCGLRTWRFDHLLTSQTEFEPFMWTRAVSPYLDLSHGYAAYEAQQKTQNSEISTIKRKLKKMEREIGPTRLEWRSTSRADLKQLLSWKSDQYLRTGVQDLFAIDWINHFVDNLLARDDANLSGLLTCLYAGDRLVAAHLGMTSQHVLHWWFPSYDRDLGRYSPGMSLIYLMAQQAGEHGITRIDLGKGKEEYKFRLASGVDHVAEGSVDLDYSSRALRRTWQVTRDWVRASPLRGPAKTSLRLIRSLKDWLTNGSASSP